MIDGTENNDISVTGEGMQITNPDAVSEVNIQTSNFDAEFGRSGGAIVNVITKSGTNRFSGSVNYFFQNDRLEAENKNSAAESFSSYDTAVDPRGPAVLVPLMAEVVRIAVGSGAGS